jgi:hypothetical protein
MIIINNNKDGDSDIMRTPTVVAAAVLGASYIKEVLQS